MRPTRILHYIVGGLGLIYIVTSPWVDMVKTPFGFYSNSMAQGAIMLILAYILKREHNGQESSEDLKSTFTLNGIKQVSKYLRQKNNG